jgi:O-antigen/teichoic acid export membrane protein
MHNHRQGKPFRPICPVCSGRPGVAHLSLGGFAESNHCNTKRFNWPALNTMSTRSSLFFSFLDRYATLAISVVSSMVIARLLTPNEIGVFSVTMVLLTFVSTVRDMGAGLYLVQEKELTTERIKAVWAVQLGLGLGLAILVLLASYPVSVFYNEPRMRDIMLLVALNYAINPFGSLTYAWLMREMRYENIAFMRFSSSLAGALVATWLAWSSFGPISLAIGSLATTVVNALIAVYFRPKFFPWLPGLGEIRRVLMFGSQFTFSSIVYTVSGSAPELLLGKLQDFTAAGLTTNAASRTLRPVSRWISLRNSSHDTAKRARWYCSTLAAPPSVLARIFSAGVSASCKVSTTVSSLATTVTAFGV